ncbi:MAG: DUF5686 family protein [Vicingaceae bacterium]
MKNLLTVILLGLCIYSQAQFAYQGRILDSLSQKPLAFVNLVAEAGKYGTTTDIDGRFNFQSNRKIDSLSISYLGYQSRKISTANLKRSATVYLLPTTFQLAEVEILPGENPAHRIINLAIENRKLNNPEEATEFYYESYNKLVFTGSPDSAYASLPDSLQRKDSSSYEGIEFLNKSHFFMMESVTERNHIPPTHTKEVVTASRISGMQTPIFTMIGTQLQSFSLYKDYLQLLGSAFLSPLSKGSTSKYLFVLEDTLYQGKDSIFSISFQPRSGKNFDGLKGFLTIHTDGYAVKNFVAEAADEVDLGIQIQQLYEKVDDKQWFPVQLNTKLIFNSVEMEDFDIYAEGRSYIKNVALESKLNKKQIGNVVLKMQEDAGKKDSTYWANYRENPLDEKEKETYHFMDSIGKEINLDKKVKVYQALFRGAVPLGPVDLLLNRLMDYNGYEGFRLGLGAETNDKVSKYFRVGGYGAYGFQDKAWKYGGHLKLNPQWDSHFSTKFSYSNDVAEVGGTQFYNDRLNPLSTEAFQKFFILRMDAVEQFGIEVETHALRDFQFTFFGNLQNRAFTSDYRYNSENLPTSFQYYRISQAGVNLRFAFREKFIEMFGVKTPISYEYPVVHFKYTHGFSDLLDGDYEFNRYDLKVEKNTRLRNLGFTTLRLNAGFVDQSIPLSLLYRSRGSLDDDLIIASDFSFQSVLPNEFFHDQYVSVFFKHSFKNLLFKSRFFKPELALVSAIGWGEMSNQSAHKNILFNTMEHGFFESGIQIDRLLGFANLGVGGYYRYGAYAFDDFEDNWTFKLTYSLKF